MIRWWLEIFVTLVQVIFVTALFAWWAKDQSAWHAMGPSMMWVSIVFRLIAAGHK